MIRNITILSFLFIVSGCTNIPISVNVIKPPAIDIGDYKNLAVSNFVFTGSSSFSEEGSPPLTEVLGEIVESVVSDNNKAITKVDPKNSYSGELVSSKLITKILKNGHFSIVERDSLNKILDEQKFTSTGMIKEEDIPELGELLGVDAFIDGFGNFSVNDKGGWYTDKDDMNLLFKNVFYGLTREISVDLIIKIISVETGEIITAIEKQKTKKVSIKKQQRDDALNSIQDWKPLVDKIIDDITYQIVNEIAPHNIKTTRLLKTGNTIAMKNGLEYAQRNLWDDAKKSWEMALVDGSEKGRKNKIHAMYNLGIYYEIHDKLDKAEGLFNDCFKQSGKGFYLDSRQRVINRKEELEKLNSLTND